jgi:hypothetical protein
VVWRARLAELRTTLTGVDPGLVRLRLGGIATASMALSVLLMSGVRALTGEPVTVVLMAAVLSMSSNLAVNEPDIGRLRVTTALMTLPALASVTAGTLLAPHRIVADVVFVAVMIAAVWIRRYGPRGNALGMAAMMGYFFTQFLRASAEQIPFLLVAVVVGIGSTLLLRGFVFPEHAGHTVERMTRAFRAHVHGLVEGVGDVLRADPGDRDDALKDLTRRRVRLNETALLVADRLEQQREEYPAADGTAEPDGQEQQDAVPRDTPDPFELDLLDAELAAERLSVAARRLVLDDRPPAENVLRPLLAGLRSLGAATATGTPRAMVPTLLDGARRSVASLVAETDGLGDRAQRVAFAITRLAGALGAPRLGAGSGLDLDLDGDDDGDGDGGDGDGGGPGDVERPRPATTGRPGPAVSVPSSAGPEPSTEPQTSMQRQLSTDGESSTRPRPSTEPRPPSEPGSSTQPESSTDPEEDGAATTAARPSLNQSTRQAIQVGVATSLAIVIGEIVSPSRWYWAVIAAFVVFAGTTSRGDVLSRGSQRVVGTIGGVVAGMGLALVVGNRALPALILMSGCVFFALYLVRVSQALMAFWITAVLALLYGLIGQFSVDTLVVRIEETAVGAAMGILAGYLILPKGTREAFGEALDTVVDAVDATLDSAVDRILGRSPGAESPLEHARDMDDALGVLRLRAKPLDSPLPRRRGRSSYQRTLRVLSAVDHYSRRLARLSDTIDAPGWASTLDPAADRIRANIEGLRRVLLHRDLEDGRAIRSAEDVVDAAEAYASRSTGHRRRAELLTAVRMLRRIDQAVVGFAADLAGAGATRDREDVVAGTAPVRSTS